MANYGIDRDRLQSNLSKIRESETNDYAWYDYGLDIGAGVFAGATDAAEETYQFTAWAADKLVEGADYALGRFDFGLLDEGGLDGRTYEEGSKFDRLFWEPPRPQTTAGQVVEDISQFGFGLLGAGKVTGLTKLGKMAATGTKKQKFAKGMVDSAISSSVAHNPYETRLSDIIQDIPALENPITDFLESDEDDSVAIRRLKMAGEDLALGALITPLLSLAKGAKKVRSGQSTDEVAKEVESEIAQATAKEKTRRTSEAAAKKKATKAAEKEQAKIETAAAKGDDVSEAPRPMTTAVMADEVEEAATKSGLTRTDALMKENKANLMQRAKLLGIKTNSRTTKKQLVEKIDQKIFPEGKKFTPQQTVEVAAPKSKVGVQKPKRTKPSKQAIANVAKNIKDPKDIQEVFDETGTNYKLFNRTQDGDVPLVNFTDELTSSLQQTINDMKPVLDKIKGTMTVDDLKAGVAARLSDATDLKPDEWVNRAFAFGKTVEEATVVLHAIESTMKDSAERIGKFATHPRYNSDGNVQAKFAAEVETMMKLVQAAKMIETPLGRGLRMRQEGIFDRKTLQAAIDDLGGEKNLERFRAAVVASGGDFAKISKAADKSFGKGRGFKALAMTGEFFRSMILFNIKTHVTNTLSGLTETVLVPMERYVGSYLTMSRNPFGAEAKAIRDDTIYHLMGLMATAKDSISVAGKSLKLEKNFLDPTNTKLDGNEVTNKISSEFVGIRGESLLGKNLDTIGKISRGSLRALGAEDEFFKQINYRSRVFAEAYKEAKVLFDAGKLTKDGMKAHALKRVDEAFDDAGRGTNLGAVQYSREITFTEELLEGSKALKLQQWVQQHPSFQLFLPFIRTPTNLIVRGVQRTPLARLASQRYRDTLKHGSPEEIAQMKGRVALGSTFLLGGLAFAMEGKITGAGPALPDQNKLWRAAGNQPYSIRVGDKWISYNRMDPLFMPIGLMANAFDISKHQDEMEIEDWFTTSVFALSTTIQDKAYLQGLANMFDLLQTDDPAQASRIESVLTNFASSFIPAAPLQVVEGLQSLNDDSPYPELSEAIGLQDKMMRRIPFMVDKLPKKYNWLTGEVVVNPDPFSTGFPVVPDKTTEFVGSNLVALNYPFKGPPRRIEGVELSSEQFSDFHQFMGNTRIDGLTLMQALDRLMKDPAYRKDGSQAYDGQIQTREIQAVTQVLSAYKQMARVELYKKYPELYREVNARKINDRAGTRLLETNR